MAELSHLYLPPHGGPGVPHVVRHLVAQEPLHVLALDPVRVLAVHGLPAGVVEPGAAHDLQARARPVDGVAAPGLQVHLVDAAAHHDEEVSLVADEFCVRAVVAEALLAVAAEAGGVPGPGPAGRVGVVEGVAGGGVAQVVLVAAAAVALPAAVVIPDNRDKL